MKKIGIFGGTFNPPHIAHLIIAETVRCKMSLDKIIFIPSGNPPLKNSSDLIDAKHRLRMANLTFANNKYFLVDDLETKDKLNKSYTIDTLKKLKEKYSSQNITFYLIVGTDNFVSLPKWKNAKDIFTLSKVIVVNRPTYKFKDGPKEFIKKVIRVRVPDLEISSSMIRNLIKNGTSIKYLVTDLVEKYILKYNLYKI